MQVKKNKLSAKKNRRNSNYEIERYRSIDQIKNLRKLAATDVAQQ